MITTQVNGRCAFIHRLPFVSNIPPGQTDNRSLAEQFRDAIKREAFRILPPSEAALAAGTCPKCSALYCPSQGRTTCSKCEESSEWRRLLQARNSNLTEFRCPYCDRSVLLRRKDQATCGTPKCRGQHNAALELRYRKLGAKAEVARGEVAK